MKKFLLFLVLLFVSITLTCSANMNFSFSEGGQSVGVNISRQGDYVYLKYDVSGFNSSEGLKNIPVEYQNVANKISSGSGELILECSTKRFRIESFNVFLSDGSLANNVSATDWIEISGEKELMQFEQLCNQTEKF